MRPRVLFTAWPRFDRNEIAFWRALRDGLHRRDMELVLASAGPCPPELDLTHITVTTTVDAFWPTPDHPAAGVPIERLGLQADALLQREALWSGPALLPAVERARRHALDQMAAERLEWLHALTPTAAVIWNGHHVGELILAAACRRGGIPVSFVERAPVADALFFDEDGLSAASRVAAEKPWPAPSPQWRGRAEAVCDEIRTSQATWWEQPARRGTDAGELRRELQIPRDACVVLFAGQVDEDTQQFLFSPAHDSNLRAFEWLLRELSGYRQVFVLGKHHPKSRIPARRYRELLAAAGVAGQWRDDLAIGDALAVADRVAAVNSTVLYEALAHDKPALALGEWLLSGQGAAYETLSARDAIPSWIAAAGLETKRRRWREALGHLLSRSLYTYRAADGRAGLHGAEALAARIADGAAATPWQLPADVHRALVRTRGAQIRNWSPADPAWPGRRDALLRRLADWHSGQSLRHALLPAYDAWRQGRRVLVCGTERARRASAQLLAAANARVTALLDVHELSLREPFVAADFILVATETPDPVTTWLDGRGFTRGADYQIVPPHLLTRLDAGLPAHTDAA